MRATISQMGPQLLSRLLELNETQTGIMNIVFKIADDRGLLLLDLKDLRSMLDYVAKNAAEFTTAYGNISSASVGAIQRSLLTLENQGADKFFGEPSFDIYDLLQCEGGKGIMNVLAASPNCIPPSCCGCCQSFTALCPRLAIWTVPSLCSSLTRPTCSLTEHQRPWWIR